VVEHDGERPLPIGHMKQAGLYHAAHDRVRPRGLTSADTEIQTIAPQT
jgi:hypothetical protein